MADNESGPEAGAKGVIEGVKPEAINGASIDVHLGDTFIGEDCVEGFVDIARRTEDAGCG